MIDKGSNQSIDRCTMPCWLCCDQHFCVMLCLAVITITKLGVIILSDLPKPAG